MSYSTNYQDLDFVNFTLTECDNLDFVCITKKKGFKKSKKREEGKKLLENLRRAKRKIKEIIKLNINSDSVMATLTYRENMQDYETANKDFKAFIRKLNNPKYLAVKELQARGAIHYHIIFFQNINIQQLKNTWLHGFYYLKEITDLNDIDLISNYLSKYLSDYKKGQLIKLNKKMFSYSRNCLTTNKKRLIDDDEINQLLSSGVASIINHNYIKIIIPKKDLRH